MVKIRQQTKINKNLKIINEKFDLITIDALGMAIIDFYYKKNKAQERLKAFAPCEASQPATPLRRHSSGQNKFCVKTARILCTNYCWRHYTTVIPR